MTLCIIVKNEAHNLKDCILSANGLADEVIVADTGSSDDSVEIARSIGARLIQIAWRNDFSWARNKCMELASNEWILFLDADERLRNPSPIRKALLKMPPHVGGIILERRDIYYHHVTRKKSILPSLVVRVFRNKSQVKYEGKVHEQIAPSILRNGFTMHAVDHARIDHLLHQQHPDFVAAKQRRYLQLIDESLEEAPSSEWLKFLKAKTLWFMDRAPEATELFRNLSLTAISAEIKTGSLNNLGSIHISSGAITEAVGMFEKSLQLNADQPVAKLLLGDCLLKQGKVRPALTVYLSLRTKINTYREGMHLPYSSFVYAHHKYYRVALCFVSSNTFIAKLLLRYALHIQPDHVDSLLQLEKIYRKQGTQNKVTKIREKLLQINPEWIALNSGSGSGS